ncbi:MAG: hypothetical protein M3463_01220 [Verrucomicrobiota bacterium]|nr:hypothetical protein [Verrucomicrobiota bacterium]
MNPDLRSLADRLFWWKTGEEAITDRHRFLAQLMTFGTWDDWQVAGRFFSEADFRSALRSASPGVFDARAWAYWHHRLQILPVPAMPARRLPDVV